MILFILKVQNKQIHRERKLVLLGTVVAEMYREDMVARGRTMGE